MAALASAVIVAGAVACAGGRSGVDGRGPLVSDIRGRFGYSVSLPLGTTASTEATMVRNTGDRAIVLDGVEPVGLGDGAGIPGAFVLPRHRLDLTLVPYRVPANGRLLPGAVVEPHAQVDLILGLKATKLGRHTFSALDVVYHVGPSSYRLRAHLAVALCVPFAPRRCAAPL